MIAAPINNLEVIILTPEFVPLGPLNVMTALSWKERFNAVGEFTVWAPLTPETAAFLQMENLVWIGGETVGVVETLIKKKDTDGGLTLQAGGRFLESWLDRRTCRTYYSKSDYVSNHMRAIVSNECIGNGDRALPHIALATNQKLIGPQKYFTANRGVLLDYILDLGVSTRTCGRLLCDVPGKTAYFTVLQGADRSIEQTDRPAVLLSSDLSDVLAANYMSDFSRYKNVAYIAGSGEGAERKEATVDDSSIGLARREMYVDARDIFDVDDTGASIAAAQYTAMLEQRGQAYLSDNVKAIDLGFTIRMTGDRAYTYGEDYFLGDRITVQDVDVGLQLSTEVSEAAQYWDEDGYTMELTLGSSAPTIKDLIARRK